MSHADDPVHRVAGLHRAAVVAMLAQIDHATCGRVHAALMQAVYAGPAVVIADLTRTDFCGYAGTDTLVRVHALAAQAGAQSVGKTVAARPPSGLTRKP